MARNGNYWDNSVQSPHNSHTFDIQPLEILTHSLNACSAIFHTIEKQGDILISKNQALQILYLKHYVCNETT